MKTNREYIKESKFDKIRSILDKSSLDKLFEEDPSFKLDELKIIETLDDELNSDNVVIEGSISLNFDAMNMHAYLELKDSVNCRCDITMDKVIQEIRSRGAYFSSRVNWDAVKKLYNEVIVEHGHSSPVLIAEGIKVKPHIPEYIIIKESLCTNLKPKVGNNDTVDYHDIDAFVYVEKGDFLGDIVPDQPGVDGKSLKEARIPYPVMVENGYKPGKNTYVSENKIYSNIDGTYKLLNGFIDIESCLSIETDVDYHTGDVSYKGDISVDGTVREGFRVQSDGDLFVNKSIEPSDIACGNNLYVKEGILGSDKFSVYAKGSVYSTHIENAIIKVGSSVNVKNSIIKSKIYSKNKLIMPKGANIIGGELYIQNGVVTGNIGNKSGVETEIVLGIDYESEEKLSKVKETIDEVIVNMAELQETLPAAKDREERDKIKFLFLSLKNRVNSLHNYARALLVKIDKNEKATLETYGTIYPGTSIKICRTKLRITDELHNVRLSLNKEIGEIIVEYLHK